MPVAPLPSNGQGEYPSVMSLHDEPILLLLRAPVDVLGFYLKREGGDCVLTVETAHQRVRLINPYPLDAAWALFMDNPGEVKISDVRSRQLESYGVEVSAVNGEGQQVFFLATSAIEC